MATKTGELILALMKRYPQRKGKWANVVEFCGIDFLSVATWPSLGYMVHGHEIKASRSDWMKELKDPYKSLSGRAMCDMWWLAAAKGVASEEEIPEDWGFMEWNGYSWWVVKRAPHLRAPFTRDPFITGDEHGTFTKAIPNPLHYEREAFAMLARRYAYAQTDRDFLLDGLDEPRPYLDRAATATGRFTSTDREAQAEWAKQQREYRRQDRERSKEWKRKNGQA